MKNQRTSGGKVWAKKRNKNKTLVCDVSCVLPPCWCRPTLYRKVSIGAQNVVFFWREGRPGAQNKWVGMFLCCMYDRHTKKD